MKILVVEDDNDLRDILVFAVRADIQLDIVEAADGSLAISCLEQDDGEIKLIICDYRMPNKNGGEVYSYLLKSGKNIPFVLCSSDKPSDYREFNETRLLFGYIEKPDVQQGIEKVLKKFKEQFEYKSITPPMHPIQIQLLYRIGGLPEDVYIKISEDRILKVLSKGDVFSEEDLLKYRRKNINALFIKDESKVIFIKRAIDEIKMKLALEEVNELPESQKLVELVQQTIMDFQITDEVVEVTRESIKKVISIIEKSPEVKKLLSELSLKEDNYLSVHSVLLCHIACAISHALTWNSEATKFKLVFASFIHDLTLKNAQLAHCQSIDEVIKKKYKRKEQDLFKKHPADAAELSKSFKEFPSDIDMIVLEHHELPDGSGFPRTLDYSKIYSLSAVFIVAQEIVNNIFAKKVDYLQIEKPSFDKGHFKKIVDILPTLKIFKTK